MVSVLRPHNQRSSFRRILCPLDLTTNAAAALPYAVMLAGAFQAKLHVLQCVDEFDGIGQCRSAEGRLGELSRWVGELAGPGLDWLVSQLPGEPAETVATVAAELAADLIVLQSLFWARLSKLSVALLLARF